MRGSWCEGMGVVGGEEVVVVGDGGDGAWCVEEGPVIGTGGWISGERAGMNHPGSTGGSVLTRRLSCARTQEV